MMIVMIEAADWKGVEEGGSGKDMIGRQLLMIFV